MTDDAVHIAAPWEPRDSLCGQSDPANVAPFDGDRPDGMAGCWTCLMAAKWMDDHLVPAPKARDLARGWQTVEKIWESDTDTAR